MILFILLTFALGELPLVVTKVILVQVFFRHGDRSAIHTFPKSQHHESDWPQGYGQLSKIGMQQHYQLGQQFRTRYADLLGTEYVNKAIYVRSTDVDRTLMSAYSNLAGLYPPDGRQIFRTNLKWQPIPVHTIPEHLDPFLDAQDVNCPRYSQLRQQASQSPAVIKFKQDNKEFMDYISSKTGIDLEVTKFSELWDTLYCQGQHKMKQPGWLNNTIMNKLYEFVLMKYNISYANFEMKKIRGGVLMNTIIENLLNKSQGLLRDKKLFMYSAHDTTLISVLNALGVYDNQVPPYASSIMLELHQDTRTNQYYVQLFYQKGPQASPTLLNIPGCGTSCPPDKFAQLYSSMRMTETEFNAKCHSGLLYRSHFIVTDGGVFWLCGILLVLVVVITFSLRKRRSRKNNLMFPEKIV